MFDESWEKFREDCFVEMKNREKSIIRKWLDEISFKGTVGYTRDIGEHSMTIFTTRPGMLIGKGGCNIPKLQEILSKEFGGDTWAIKFIEIQGDFVTK